MNTPSILTDPIQPTPIYAVFCGVIDLIMAQKIATNLSLISQQKENFNELHLMFQSTGGSLADGIFLYNLFKSSPVEIFIYNGGAVQSSAAIAYLGAQRKFVSKVGTFMFHRTTYSLTNTTEDKLIELSKAGSIENRRTLDILKDNKIPISDETWANLGDEQLLYSAEDAVKNKIAHEIREFAPPRGGKLWSFSI